MALWFSDLARAREEAYFRAIDAEKIVKQQQELKQANLPEIKSKQDDNSALEQDSE